MTAVAPIDNRPCRRIRTTPQEILPNELAVLNQRAKQQSPRWRRRPARVDLPLQEASMQQPSGTRPNTKYNTHRSRAEDFEECLLQSSCRKRKRQLFSSPVSSEQAPRTSHLDD